MFEFTDGDRPRLRLTDHHHHRAIVQKSLLRPGHLALITPPGQKAIFLTPEDAAALRDYITDYLTTPQEG